MRNSGFTTFLDFLSGSIKACCSRLPVSCTLGRPANLWNPSWTSCVSIASLSWLLFNHVKFRGCHFQIDTSLRSAELNFIDYCFTAGQFCQVAGVRSQRSLFEIKEELMVDTLEKGWIDYETLLETCVLYCCCCQAHGVWEKNAAIEKYGHADLCGWTAPCEKASRLFNISFFCRTTFPEENPR